MIEKQHQNLSLTTSFVCCIK